MDQIKKVITSDKKVVIMAIEATDALQESMKRLKAFPPSMVHLGQAMMGASLLHSLWNEKGNFDKASLQWKVNGPFGHVFAEANGQGEIRGTILKPQAPINNYDTPLGNGQLVVQKFGQKNSTGIVTSKGNICNDLVSYLHQSEQRHATMSLSVKIGWDKKPNAEIPLKVEYGLGFLIDVLPDKSKEETEGTLLNWDRFVQSLGPISTWNLPSQDKTEGIVSMLNPQPGKELLFQKIKFHCNCSVDRAERAIKLAEKHDPSDNPKEPLEVQCEFCGKIYLFNDDSQLI